MRNVKTIVSLPAWAEAYNEGQIGSNKVADVQTAYAKVPLVFRAARIRANALQKIPVHFRRIGAEKDAKYPFEMQLSDIIWRSELALCLHGGATWLRQKTQFESMGFDIAQGLAWLNPFLVTLQWLNDRREFYQQIGNKRYPAQGVWTDDDVVFIREFHPTDDVSWGISPASVALGAGQLSFYLNRVASLFFEQGAMPLTIATIAGLSSNPEDEANKRVQGFFRRATSTIGNAFRILAVGNDVKMQTTQAALKDMVIPELKQQARKDVALAFEIPVTLLDDDANYATAQEHKRGFYDETVIPRAQMIESELNRQWLNDLGFEIAFAPEEMDLYQEDESARATSLSQLVSAIATDPLVARFSMGVLGYDLSDKQTAELDKMIAAKDARRDAMTRATQTPPEQVLEEDDDEEETATTEQKAIERRQFKKFVESGRDANAFKFFRLSEVEQLALKAEHAPNVFALKSAPLPDDADRRVREQALRERIVKLLDKRQAEVVAKIQAGEGVDLTQFQNDLQRLIENELTTATADEIARTATGVGFEFETTRYNEAAREWAREYSYELVKGLTDKTRKVIQDATSQFIATPGMTRGDLQDLLIPAFGAVRADAIAVTEMTRAYSQAQTAYKEMLAGEGITMERVWHTLADEAVCDVCRNLNRTVENEQGLFVAFNGKEYDNAPAHVNCRCVVELRLKK